MALITSLSNSASVTYNGSPINSNSVQTLLLLAPTVVKVVDKALASIGEDLTYTVTVTNVSASALTNLPFKDVLPAGVTYQTGTFKVNGTAVTPTLTGNTLTYTIPNITALGTAIITFQVEVVGGNT